MDRSGEVADVMRLLRDGHISRRDFLVRTGALGVSLGAAGALLAACGSEATPVPTSPGVATPGPATAPPAGVGTEVDAVTVALTADVQGIDSVGAYDLNTNPVVNQIIEPLMRSGGIDAFAFIGRASTANRLLSLHPGKNRLRSLLGLGAKNAAVVLEDADLEVAVRECLLGALAFNGQRCAAIKIIFVHRNIADAFLAGMSGALKGVKTGMPWEKDVRITPLADAARVPVLSALIADAVKGGARVINEGGGLVRGTIMSPALVFPVNDKMDLYHEEQFGPIIPVVPFDELAEPVGYIQSSIYGQQASVFGRGRETVAGFIRSMRTSVARVNVNAKCQRGPEVFPFTGRNDSAHGDFASPAVLEFFSETFAVTHRADPARGRARVKSA